MAYSKGRGPKPQQKWFARPWERRINLRIPETLYCAIRDQAAQEGRSVNAQMRKILADGVDWSYYEQNENMDVVYVYPNRRFLNVVHDD